MVVRENGMQDATANHARAQAPDFGQVWQMLLGLEGNVVTTFGSRKRSYRIVEVSEKGVLREAQGSTQPERKSLVGQPDFSKMWGRLATLGVSGLEGRNSRFVAACLAELPKLGLWYAKADLVRWNPAELLVLRNPASGHNRATGLEKTAEECDNSRIAVDPEYCGGKPRIRGTRIWVGIILSLYAAGYTPDGILQTYPSLTMKDLEAALEYSKVKVYSGLPVGRN